MTASSAQPTPEQADYPPAGNAVNEDLTSKGTKPAIENSEYAAFARRILRAYSRRVAVGDIEALADLICLSEDIDDAVRRAVGGLRVAGYSWAEIGARLGISRQAAQQRWGHSS